MEHTISIQRDFTNPLGFNIRVKLTRESIIILCIGVLDLISTLVWIDTHGAQEANPLFRYYLSMGPAWFIMMKVVMLTAPIFLLEWARRRRPNFTLWASRFAIGAYLALYMVGVARLNPDLLRHHPEHATIASLESRMGDSFNLSADDPTRGFMFTGASGPSSPSEGLN